MADRLEVKNHGTRPVIIKTSTETLTVPPQGTAHIFEALITVRPAAESTEQPSEQPSN